MAANSAPSRLRMTLLQFLPEYGSERQNAVLLHRTTKPVTGGIRPVSMIAAVPDQALWTRLSNDVGPGDEIVTLVQSTLGAGCNGLMNRLVAFERVETANDDAPRPAAVPARR